MELQRLETGGQQPPDKPSPGAGWLRWDEIGVLVADPDKHLLSGRALPGELDESLPSSKLAAIRM
jgi:hypothetical protein